MQNKLKKNHSPLLQLKSVSNLDKKDINSQEQQFNIHLARVLLKTLRFKDDYTYEHSLRVAYFSLLIGRKMQLSAEELYNLELGALFHDIGKIGIPDNILLKPQRLEQCEFEKMSQHPSYSEDILKTYPGFEIAAKIVRHHHERFDGKGYPDKLKGENIPHSSRIVLIADTFDAMISDRPYRKGLSYDIAFEELKEFSGSQFDPDLVTHFIAAMSENQEEFNSLLLPEHQFKKVA